jgi:MFS superfamily sulfate permease-like transporter
MGTSSHSAVGTYAIVSGLMTGDVVLQVMSDLGKDALSANPANSTSLTPHGFEDITNPDIVIMTAVVVGIYIAAFGIFQLGFLSDYLPDELIGGFLTSASIYVFTSQIRYLLGVNYTFYSGVLALIRTYIEIFSRLKEVNLITLLISGVCLIVLLIFKEVINVQVEKRLGIKLPFPIDLCLVIGGTLISSYVNLSQNYHVKVVGSIPNG